MNCLYCRISLGLRLLLLLAAGVLWVSAQDELPEILEQPARQILRTGDPLTLKVEVKHLGDGLQWFHNGEALEGETDVTFAIESVEEADAGKYFVSVTNDVGTVFSEHARVSVRPWNLDKSVARQWMEELLDAIRLDYPAPTVHSRNLFSLSCAMWDAWAAYDASGKSIPYLADENPPIPDNGEAVLDARSEAISYAAYRVLRSRFRLSPNVAITSPAFTERFELLGYDPAIRTTEGDSPAAVGNRIAAKVLAFGWADGANERAGYADQTSYKPTNRNPLVFELPGTKVTDPNHWQPLAFDHLVLQNGIVIGRAEQTFLGPNWGWVTPFALTRSDENDVYSDPGPPPYLGGEGDQDYKDAALQVIEFSSWLDPSDGEFIDVSPKSRHNNTLGTNDGVGYLENPVTGLPYEENVVLRADYGRILAEFWADGPDSETPPGHWNSVANYVTDHALFEKRFEGEGEMLDDLEWDVKLYFAMNGAVSDAAIACWDAKRKYDYVRPITMIRYMGGLGQSSDSEGPSYHPEGLPLKPGLVEVVTEESAAEGERHAHLGAQVGEVAIRCWTGIPGNPTTEYGGVGWIRAVEWMPYQRDTFVTPPFGAYTSGHSTFSRAGAEVLSAITGSEYFPGGISSFTAKAHEFLEFESGPEEDITLTWATYYDAADEAGISRLYGGIHVWADDLRGRIMGSEIGKSAFAKAKTYFDGTGTTQDWDNAFEDWVAEMISDPDQPTDPQLYEGDRFELLATHFLRDLSLVSTSPETRVKLVYGKKSGKTTIGVECYINLATVPHEIKLQVSDNLRDWVSIPSESTYVYKDPVGLDQNRMAFYVKESDLPEDAHFLRVNIVQY